MKRHARLVTLVSMALLGAWLYRSSAESASNESSAAAQLRWYKGNTHTHSLWSDGNDYPEMIVDYYRRNGYQFLALSDHNVLSRGEKWLEIAAANKRGDIGGFDRYVERFGREWVETREVEGKRQVRLKALDEFRGKFEQRDEFVLVQAEEITDKFGKLPVHINGQNLRELIRPQGGESVREVIANNLAAVEQQSRTFNQPMLAHVNHPNFGYGVTAEDLAAVASERFFEVYNGHPGVAHRGDAKHVSIERMWDIANSIRLWVMHSAPLYGLATDDSHNYFGDRGASPGRGWVMVQAASLAPDALITAMQAGQFYSSSGVTLDTVRFDHKTRTLHVSVQSEPGATYTIDFVGSVPPSSSGALEAFDRDASWIGKNLSSHSGLEASYQLTGNELYVRAEITSSQKPANPSFAYQKQQAWTQPVGWEGRIRK